MGYEFFFILKFGFFVVLYDEHCVQQLMSLEKSLQMYTLATFILTLFCFVCIFKLFVTYINSVYIQYEQDMSENIIWINSKFSIRTVFKNSKIVKNCVIKVRPKLTMWKAKI